MKRLDILYEDRELIVVNKPSGLLALPGRGEDKWDSVTTRAREMFSDLIEQPAVHRLDMDTSGIMVLARDKKSHAVLSRQFMDRTVSKRYEALLQGVPEGQSGVIELAFRLDVENRPLQIYDPLQGKLGVTEWRMLQGGEDSARVEFFPKTGRTHQLRVHASHALGLGCPIVGDTLYGGHDRHGELMLHASDIGFNHPSSNQPLTFHSAPAF